MITRAWVAHARALAESLREHHPEARLSVLIVDPTEGFVDPAAEQFEIVAPGSLDLAEFDAMSVRYGTTELCCALKPSIISHLLAGEEPVVYMDSDMRLYAPLDGLEGVLAEHPFVLAPHLLQPLDDDGREPSELAILRGGSFNLGFVAARDTPEVRSLLSWWAERLRTGSRLAPERGMVFDQRWADLMPGMFGCVGRWRDPGVNFGYWRAATSKLGRDAEGYLVDGRRLRSFHFSGFDPRRPERLSEHDNRSDVASDPVLVELCGRFAERLSAHGHARSSQWPYGFGCTASGSALEEEVRELWDRAARAGELCEPPFSEQGEAALLDWLAAPEDGVSGPPMSRYLRHVYLARPKLQTRFPDVDGRDRAAFLAWSEEQAERDPGSVAGLLRARADAPGPGGLRRLQPGESLDVRRGDAVVCIPVYGAREQFAECLRSVLEHTPAGTRLLIADDASPDPAIAGFLESLAAAGRLTGREVAYLRQPENLGFPGNVNAAFAAAAPADVVVLNSDCVVADGWLDGMRRAAYSDAQVATSSALTNHGTILSVPERNRPQPGLPQDLKLEQAAAAVVAQSLRLYPRLPTAIGHCMYVRRQALDLVGDFDPAFSPGYGEEVDFSQRCLLHGLVHVAADDVYVLHHSGGSLSEDGSVNPVQEEHERIIESRYPYYQRAQTAASKTELGPLPRSLAAGRRAIRGLSVTVDARCLGPLVTGTQVHTLEVIRALSRSERVLVRVIVPPEIGEYARGQLAGLDHVELLPHSDVHPAMVRTDVAHRPYQVSDANDLLVLRCVGERTVITHQDLIAYRNPGYFPGYPHWERHRRLTRQALAVADEVVFFSHHAARDALREDLVDSAHARVIYIGVDHTSHDAAADAPAGVEQLGERPMLLCLGTDFRHKNRVFAMRLLAALRREQGFDATLVLAGPRVSHGSSAGEEADFLARHPELAAHVIVLPAVREPEKAWLMARCSAVLYPTAYEGFGLMPFEAAAFGRPCLFASLTALAETLPPETATLVPWDPHLSAQRVRDLLASRDAVEAHVRAIRRAGQHLTWQSAGEALVDSYWRAAASPARLASGIAGDLAQVEIERDEIERKYNELWQALTPEARALLGPEGPLNPAEIRTLAAASRRPLLRRILLGPLRLAYRIAGGRSGQAHDGAATSADTFALHFAYSNQEHMREQIARTDSDSLVSEP